MGTYLIPIILTSTLLLYPSGSHACDSGWFGSLCEYKCHCQNDNCDTDGTCTGDNKCERGWFGPLCQYVDLVQKGNIMPVPQGIDVSMVKNGDDGSCISGLQSVTINWNTAYPFTWMRVVVKDSVSPDSLQVSFKTASMPTAICTNRRYAHINSRTVDIQCDLNVTVQEVTLSGDGVKSLCSLYVSGGRNVALKQTTTQSTTYDIWYSYKAVDGTATSTSNPATFCSSTNESPSFTQSWTITLSRSRLVNRYVLYNRIDSGGVYAFRLQKFTIRSLNENGALVFNYTDPGTIQDVYTVPSVPVGSPVLLVQIYANDPDSKNTSILTLCEFEMYSECPPKSYQFDCSQPCSDNCQDSMCHHANGHCYACYPGKIGDFCNLDCPAGYYGHECTAVCNRTCGEDKSCHGENGQCSHGCQPGYKGLWCEEVLSSVSDQNDDDDGLDIPLGLIVGVTVAAVCLIAVVVVGMLLWRRRQACRHKGATEREYQSEGNATLDSNQENNRASLNDHDLAGAKPHDPGTSELTTNNTYYNVLSKDITPTKTADSMGELRTSIQSHALVHHPGTAARQHGEQRSEDEGSHYDNVSQVQHLQATEGDNVDTDGYEYIWDVTLARKLYNAN